MKVFECIKEIIAPDKDRLTGMDIGTKLGQILPVQFEWMDDNYSMVNRINGIVFNEYITSTKKACTAPILKALLQKKPSMLSDKIILNIDSSEIKDTIRNKWQRIIDGRTPKGDSSLDYAILLCIVIAYSLRDTQSIRIKQYYKLLNSILEEINVNLSNKAMVALIPWNYETAYIRWKEIVSQCETHFDLEDVTTKKQIIESIKFSEPSQFYDVLCVLLYILLRYKKLTDDEKGYFSEQWQRYLEEYIAQQCKEFSFLKNANENERIEEAIWGAKENFSKEKQETNQNDHGNNELGRDPKFLRQSNLYYEVDMKAINRVLSDFSRPGIVVLDLGCGDGQVTFSRFGVIPSVEKIIAIDSDDKQVLRAKNLFNSKQNPKLVAETLDMNEYDFVLKLKDTLKRNNIRHVDIIFASLSLHNVNDPESLVGILSYEILAPGGYFIIREVEDETKIYYSKDTFGQNYMLTAANDYKKLFGFTDRNAARKMYSWFVNQDFENIELFYDIVDTCNRSEEMKEDIFNITMGFRKYRAEKYYEELKKSKIANEVLEENAEICTRIVNANNKMLTLFKRPDFWFCFTNYVAIGKKPKKYKSMELKRDIEIYLVRHAHCNYDNKNKSHKISAMGKKQINELEIRLKEVIFDTVYCSTYNRAIKTAEPIARTHDLIIHNYPELNEIDRGKVPSDKEWEENKELYSLWKKHKTDMAFPDGESGTSAWLRAKYVIDRIRNEVAVSGGDSEEPYRVCIVTHGGLIRTIICGLLGLPQTCRYQLAEKIDNCSISMLRIRKDVFKNPNTDYNVTLETLNDTSHLSENV